MRQVRWKNTRSGFDDLFTHVAQRRGFREYLAGLLAPRECSKTLTCLAGAEPVTGSKLPAVQRLQFFLSESVWDPEQVNARRLALLRADPVTALHGGGVLVIDDSGDRKCPPPPPACWKTRTLWSCSCSGSPPRLSSPTPALSCPACTSSAAPGRTP
jgi:hypothetical protein